MVSKKETNNTKSSILPPTTIVSHTTQLPSVPSATLDQSFSNILYSPYTNIPPVYYPVDPSRQISSLNVSHQLDHSGYIPSTQILPPSQLGDITHSSYSENMDDDNLSDKLPYHQQSSITNHTSTSSHHSTNPLDHSDRSSPSNNGLADPTCTLSSPSYTTSDFENMDDGNLSDKLPYQQQSSITDHTSTIITIK